MIFTIWHLTLGMGSLDMNVRKAELATVVDPIEQDF
jgi:hypothetical protein